MQFKNHFYSILLGGLGLLLVLTGRPAEASEIRDAVVKIFVTYNSMDYYRPWQSRGSQSSSGSGFIIEGNKILTNAHVATDSTFIQVRKESSPQKYTARVVAIGHDCDLAILEVDDKKFFEGIDPLPIGELPNLLDPVSVVGFPRGGDKLSITEGVVSRVEIVSYRQSSKQLLSVQIDAAINPGNSGGPVLDRSGKVVGVAMQVMRNSQNIGYIIPVPIINHFLDDLDDKQYDGFPSLGVEFQNMDNDTLREYYKLTPEDEGVLVTRVLPYTAAEGYLQEGDVILSVDEVPIGVDGSFEFRRNERLALSYLINQKQAGEKINFVVKRKGENKSIDLPLSAPAGLVPPPDYFGKPPYYIYGGLVFTQLSSDLLGSWGSDWWNDAPLNFLNYLFGAARINGERNENVVVLLQVLPDTINVGYHGLNNEVITKFNDKPVKSFSEFVKMIEKNGQEIAVFETENMRQIVLKTEDIENVNRSILERNHIPAQYSDGSH